MAKSQTNVNSTSNPLMPVTKALEELLTNVTVCSSSEVVSLKEAVGRVLAQQEVSKVDVPPQDNSSMDGYAVSIASLNEVGSTSLRLSQRIVAGTAPSPLLAGTAARIFTGAEVPAGADAVVMQEKVELVGDSVVLPEGVTDKQNIRPRGQDLKRGEVLHEVGRRLLPADLGVLASAGIGELKVYKKLKVAILSTGDELVEPGLEIGAGKIYNSNKSMLAALIQKLNMEVVDLGKVSDTAEDTVAALGNAANQADIIISTGGVSVGDEDHVKAAVEQLGELNMWRIKLKPGKPLAFGKVKGIPFFGLPGNPASALITFCLFARPYLIKLQGGTYEAPMRFSVTAEFDHHSPGTREEYMRGVFHEGKVSRFTNQSSGMLSTASKANGLIVIPVGASFSAGGAVDFIPFNELLN